MGKACHCGWECRGGLVKKGDITIVSGLAGDTTPPDTRLADVKCTPTRRIQSQVYASKIARNNRGRKGTGEDPPRFEQSRVRGVTGIMNHCGVGKRPIGTSQERGVVLKAKNGAINNQGKTGVGRKNLQGQEVADPHKEAGV